MKSPFTPHSLWKSIYHGTRTLLAKALILPIRFYQQAISPLTPPSCRFTPSCSQYAIEALRQHGPFKGLLLATWRILRCNPWGGHGYDPVPKEWSLFRRKK